MSLARGCVKKYDTVWQCVYYFHAFVIIAVVAIMFSLSLAATHHYVLQLETCHQNDHFIQVSFTVLFFQTLPSFITLYLGHTATC